MNLSTLLTQITPLPWDTGCLRTRVEILPPGWNAPMLVADCHGKHAPESEDERVANAAYLAHTANLFPELVKALEDELAALELWIRAANVPDDLFDGMQISRDKIKQLLARANEIKV